jgi:cytochrome c553
MRRLVALALSLPLATVLITPSLGRAEPHARPRDFKCLLKGKKPDGKDFYVFNRNRVKLRQAVAMSETGELPDKGYPVGTILQVLPFEAMIKRRPGYNPDGNDWEFVRLMPTPNGRTQILADGRAEVANALGSCQGCHKALAQQHDLVCGFVIGAAGLGLTEQQLANIQAADPRCKPK